MTDASAPQSAGWRMKLAIFSLAVSIFTVLWFAVAALGSKWGWWPWQVGLGQMTFRIGPMLIIASLAMSVIALTAGLFKFPRFQPTLIAAVALLIAGSIFGRVSAVRALGKSVPPIHDIQTDWSDPISFSDTLLQLREADGALNPVKLDPVFNPESESPFAGRRIAEIQAEAEAAFEDQEAVYYKRLDPLYFDQSPTELSATIASLVEKKGWELVSAPAETSDTGVELQVEATATSAMYGFKDDVAIRIRPVEGATRVDMRSISRVGTSDLGANSKRINLFMRDLQDKADGREVPR